MMELSSGQIDSVRLVSPQPKNLCFRDLQPTRRELAKRIWEISSAVYKQFP